VRAIVATLVEVLATPSSSVQTAVSACLTPLMPGLAADRAFTDGLVQAMLKRLLQGQSYGDRWATRAAPCTLPAALAETAPVQGMQGVRHEGAVGGVCHHSLPHLSAVQARRGPGAGGHREGPGYQRHQRLKAAMDDQGNAGAREGALLALECLCASLGRRALGASVVTPQPRADAPACRPCAIRA